MASDEGRYRILSELRAATRGGDVDVPVQARRSGTRPQVQTRAFPQVKTLEIERRAMG
jgi:hypothetical protein